MYALTQQLDPDTRNLVQNLKSKSFKLNKALTAIDFTSHCIYIFIYVYIFIYIYIYIYFFFGSRPCFMQWELKLIAVNVLLSLKDLDFRFWTKFLVSGSSCWVRAYIVVIVVYWAEIKHFGYTYGPFRYTGSIFRVGQ